MKKIWKSMLSVGLAGLVAFGCFACDKTPEEEKANISVKALYSTEKIEKTEDISGRADGGVDISLAKGESEGDQIAVLSDKEFTYTFTVSDLTCGENVFPKENIEVSKMLYTECKEKVYSGAKAAGYYVDAVVPMEYIEKAGENVMEKDVNNFFWVDIDAPKNIAAGVYTGVITLKSSVQEYKIPVSVEVFDFTISDLPYMESIYSIWLDGNFMMYGELESGEDIYNRYLDTLLEYNVSARPYGTTTEQFIKNVRKYYDKITAMVLPVNYIGTTKFDEDDYYDVMYQLAKASIEDGKNYFEKAYHRLGTIYDEFQEVSWRIEHVRPTIEACDAIEQKVVDKLIEEKLIADENTELAQSIFNLRHNMTAWYEEEWADVINCYCTAYDRVRSTTADLQHMTELIGQDNVYWTYGCITHDAYPNPTTQINDYLVSARDLFWFNYEYDITGDLFWCVNQYCYASGTIDGMWKPHTDLYTDASHDKLTNGDGYLLYPGLNYDSEYPFPSHRLIVRRDGIDDHTYMSQLGEKYEELAKSYGADTKDAKSLVAFLNKQLLGRGASKLNDSVVMDVRKSLADAIVMSEQTGTIIDSLEFINNELSYVIYTDGSDLSINGSSVAGVASGSGKKYSGKIAFGANGQMTISIAKNGKTYSVTLLTPTQGTIRANFDDANDVSALKVDEKYGSSVVSNSDCNLTVNGVAFGNNAKVTLSGHNFSLDEGVGEQGSQWNNAYQPSVKFDISNDGKTLSDVSSIEYWVYNSQSNDITVEIFVEKNQNGAIETVLYDKVNLYASKWTKITMDNFNVISLNSSVLKKYTAVGFRVDNLLDNGGNAYSYAFLVDEIIVR